ADAQARARSPEAALPLLRAFELRDRLPTLAPLVQLFRQYAEWRAADPEVRSLARFLLASVERSRGRSGRSDAQLARLGFITTFHAIGPFDNEGKSGCDTVYPPEEELDLAARYPGKSSEIGWRRLPDGSPLGYVNLGEAIHPSNETATYALAVLESASDEKVVFHLGASGGSRLWVNQTRVFADDTYHPPRFDQAQVAVTLRKGANRVLFKLCQASGPHGFFLRVSGADGRAVSGLKISAPDQLPAAPPGPVAYASKPTLVDHFRRRAESSRASAQALAEYAEILAHRQTFDSTERRDANQAARAARLAPEDPQIQMLAARTANDHNERSAFLRALLAAQPHHPEAALGLAAHDLTLDLPRRALDTLTPAFEQNPGYFPLGLLKARALELLGLDHQAEGLVRELARLFPDRPEIVRELASLEQRRGHPREALAFHRVALALRYDDSAPRRSLVSGLIALGRVEEAMKEQRELNLLEPWSVETWLRTAELAAANGLFDEAREGFARAREIAPENAEVFEREGHALARLNDTAGATASLARALELRPQDPRIKEALKALRGEGQGFGEDLAREAAKVIAETRPLEGEDSVVLSEVVATKVFPSGLASRFEQLIVRAQTPRGVEAERNQWVTYSPDRQELRILRARVIRPDGSIVESHAESERSLSDTSTRLYYDARARLVSFPTLAPGDVVELSYRLDDTANDNLLSDYFGDVQGLQSEAIKARFDYYLFAPPGRTIYSNEPGVGLEKREEAQPDGSRLYHWSGRDLPKLTPEPGMPGGPEVAEPLHVSTYKDWDSVGRYYWGLVRDQLTPTDEIREQVAELKKTVPAGDELAMIRAVYDFVVSRTRYVGLEFGIHGYKPYRVDKVLARRFGDCKDKASLMNALLRVAGIDSRLVLLRMKRLR
ncbi:MAG TPA: cell division protein FtsK, partial [Myxococcales bacterium]|nr:cell division protein FtsK [Myxococcales bacterium]